MALFLMVTFFGYWPFLYDPLSIFEILIAVCSFAVTYAAIFVVFLGRARCDSPDAASFSPQFRAGLLDCSQHVPQLSATECAFTDELPIHLPANVDAARWMLRGSAEYHKRLLLNVSDSVVMPNALDIPWYYWMLNLEGLQLFPALPRRVLPEPVLDDASSKQSASPTDSTSMLPVNVTRLTIDLIRERGFQFPDQMGDDAHSKRLHGIFNPVMSWSTSFLGTVFCFVMVILGRQRKAIDPRSMQMILPRVAIGSLLCAGWLFGMVPYLVVFKGGPAFKYFPALFFAQMLTAVTVDLMIGPARTVVSVLLIVLQLVCYVAYIPWVYGITVERTVHGTLGVIPGWMRYLLV